MSDSNSPSSKPPQSDPSRESRPNSPRRGDRPQTANVLLWLAVGLAAVLLAYYFMNNEHKGKLLSLGEFEAGIQGGKFTPANVFELTISPGYLRFQNQPSAKRGDAAEDAKPVVVTSVPTYMMGAE